MKRRHFLTALSAAAAGLVLDPERLLWVPGERSYVFIQAPLYKPSLAELVAVTFDKVIAERQKAEQTFWRNTAMLRGIVDTEYVRLESK